MNMNIKQMEILANGDDALMAQLNAVYNGEASEHDMKDLAIWFAEKYGMDNIRPERMFRALSRVA